MKIIPLLQKEFDREAAITRKFFERLPEEHFEWRPHEKSMNLQELAVHLARLLEWIPLALKSDELDLAALASGQSTPGSAEEIMELFDETCKNGRSELIQASEKDLLQEWTMSKRDQVLAVWTKYEAIRTALNHAPHHRAQLGVYYRLLDIPVPATYFRSADDAAY